LDCDEVHDSSICPVCGSESFTYISRWVPVPDAERPPRSEPSEQATIYRELLSNETNPRKSNRLLKGGLLGLTALGIASWASWRSSRTNTKG
jgi:hypothetical protein